MQTRILVPVDGSALADGIMKQLRRLLVRSDQEVALLTVVPEGEAATLERRRQEARDHLVLCAAECRLTVDELLEAATAHLESKEGDDGGTLYLGHLTPEIMFDTEAFWRAYQAVTGRETNGDAGDFVRCAC